MSYEEGSGKRPEPWGDRRAQKFVMGDWIFRDCLPVIPSDALMFGYSDVERSRFYYSLAFQGLAGSFWGGDIFFFVFLSTM